MLRLYLTAMSGLCYGGVSFGCLYVERTGVKPDSIGLGGHN